MAACLFALLLATLTPIYAAGQIGADASTTNSGTRPARLLFWRVASPTAVVYLLGSIHVGWSGMYPLPAPIEAAFSRARTLVLELPVDAATQLEAAEKIGRAGTYAPGDALDRHVGAEVLESLQAYLAKTGTSLERVRTFRPWFVSMLVSLGELQRLGYTPQQGVDQYFARMARPEQNIEALESVDDQVALFAGMSAAVQEQTLKEALRNLPTVKAQMEQAMQLWTAGDGDGLDALWMRPLRVDFPELYREVFVKRNQRMEAAIERYLRSSGEHFVIVGSGHAVGPDGIVSLLRGKGFSPVQQ